MSTQDDEDSDDPYSAQVESTLRGLVELRKDFERGSSAYDVICEAIGLITDQYQREKRYWLESTLSDEFMGDLSRELRAAKAETAKLLEEKR